VTYQILYSSVATEPMDRDALRSLLEQSRRRNIELDVTGALIYFEPTREFFQVLEGERDVLHLLMRSIVADGRHRCVIVAVEDEVKARSFNDWAMGYLLLDDADEARRPGYAAVLQEGVRALHLTGQSSIGLRLFELIRSSLKAAELTD
jgi:Sensors of blue-light using FAD